MKRPTKYQKLKVTRAAKTSWDFLRMSSIATLKQAETLFLTAAALAWNSKVNTGVTDYTN